MRRSDMAVAGSEDQPGKSFEFRVPGFELEGTHFKTWDGEVREAYSSAHFEVNRES